MLKVAVWIMPSLMFHLPLSLSKIWRFVHLYFIWWLYLYWMVQLCLMLCAASAILLFMTFPQLFTPFLFSFHIYASMLQSPGSKKSETSMDQRDSIILTPKNVQASRKQARCFLQLYHDPFFFWHIFRLVSFWTQALRTLFNVAHRLHNVLGPSWVLVSNCVPFFF